MVNVNLTLAVFANKDLRWAIFGAKVGSNYHNIFLLFTNEIIRIKTCLRTELVRSWTTTRFDFC